MLSKQLQGRPIEIASLFHTYTMFRILEISDRFPSHSFISHRYPIHANVSFGDFPMWGFCFSIPTRKKGWFWGEFLFSNNYRNDNFPRVGPLDYMEWYIYQLPWHYPPSSCSSEQSSLYSSLDKFLKISC